MRGAIAAFALIVIAALWAGVVTITAHDWQFASAEAMKANANLARALEEHTVRTLKSVDQISLMIKQQYERHGRQFDLARYFRDAQLDPRLFVNAVITDPRGDVVLGSTPGFKVVNLADRAHIRVHVAADSGRLHIGAPVVARVAQRSTIPVTRRINNPDGSYGGVVGVAIDPFYFSQFYLQVDLGAHGVAALVGNDGVLRASAANIGPEARQDFDTGPLLAHALKNDHGSYVSTATAGGEVRRILSYRALGDYPLIIAVGVAEETALAEVAQRARDYYLGATLVTLLLLAVAWWLMAAALREQKIRGTLQADRERLAAQQAALSGLIGMQNVPGAEPFADFTRRVARALAVERVSIWRLADGGGTLACVHEYSARTDGAQAGRRLSAAECPRFFAALAADGIIAADDAVRDARTAQLADRMLRPQNIGALMGVPFHVFGRTAGFLCCEHAVAPRHWTVDEQTFALAAASLAALTYERAERRQTQAALDESRQRQATLLESMPDPAWLKDRDGCYVAVNQSWLSRNRLTRENVIGRHDHDFFPAALAADIEAEDARIMQSGAEMRLERLRGVDADARWVDVIKTPILRESGEIGGIVGISRDVTARRAAETAVRESEVRLKAIMDHSATPICLQDLAGRYLMVNRVYAEMAGLRPEEFAGKRAEEVFAGQPDGKMDAVMAKVRAARAAMMVEETVQTPAGPHVYLAVKFPLLDGAGEPYAIGSISTDITQRQHDEELVRHVNRELAQKAAALTAANQQLESFAFSVSHDLRAPLRHISGYVGFLQERSGAQLDNESQRYLNRIARATERLGMLIDDLLAFSRTGRAEMLMANVDLDALARDVAGECQAYAPQRGIDWKIGALPLVTGDRALLRQVLVNLVDNAIKYSGTREHASIEIGSTHGKDGETVVYVRDNGVGFDMQYAHKLFGVFQRLHRADEFEGTGIGLANVRQIVERHGGRVWAEGVPNQGATFFFALTAVGRARHG